MNMEEPPRNGRRERLWALAFCAIAASALLFASAFRSAPADAADAAPEAVLASFVGAETCASCHKPEANAWRGSHHALAMQHATQATVLGDFNNASFEHFGQRSRFFRDGDKFLVETDGADGKLATFEIKFTFGVEPLQQYLVAFPDGRLQALPIAWDSRPKEQGGQRWMHLYPGEHIDSNDELHWTKISQNWNFMCASCHSTNLHKNFDAATDTFHTDYSELNVACEVLPRPGLAPRRLGEERRKRCG